MSLSIFMRLAILFCLAASAAANSIALSAETPSVAVSTLEICPVENSRGSTTSLGNLRKELLDTEKSIKETEILMFAASSEHEFVKALELQENLKELANKRVMLEKEIQTRKASATFPSGHSVALKSMNACYSRLMKQLESHSKGLIALRAITTSFLEEAEAYGTRYLNIFTHEGDSTGTCFHKVKKGSWRHQNQPASVEEDLKKYGESHKGIGAIYLPRDDVTDVCFPFRPYGVSSFGVDRPMPSEHCILLGGTCQKITEALLVDENVPEDLKKILQHENSMQKMLSTEDVDAAVDALLEPIGIVQLVWELMTAGYEVELTGLPNPANGGTAGSTVNEFSYGVLIKIDTWASHNATLIDGHIGGGILQDVPVTGSAQWKGIFTGEFTSLSFMDFFSFYALCPHTEKINRKLSY